MKKLTITLIGLLMIALTACSNPVSSEYNDNQGNENGHSPLYSGTSERG